MRRCRTSGGSPSIRSDHVNRHDAQRKVTMVSERTSRTVSRAPHVDSGHFTSKAAATLAVGGTDSGCMVDGIVGSPRRRGCSNQHITEHGACERHNLVTEDQILTCVEWVVYSGGVRWTWTRERCRSFTSFSLRPLGRAASRNSAARKPGSLAPSPSALKRWNSSRRTNVIRPK